MIEITDKEFEEVKDIMYNTTGVFLKPSKRTLVITRLRTRLEELGLETYAQYAKLLKEPKSSEMEVFINALTTNETYCFRHAKQFNYLFETVFPYFIEKNKNKKTITIWTAASSTGEEPCSLAISTREFLKKHPGWKFKVLASDINSQVITDAKEGLFPERSLKDTPDSLKKKYFEHIDIGKKRKIMGYKVCEQIKKDIQYFQHNLLDKSTQKDIDILFLRNVMIYFDTDTKQKVIRNLEHSVVSDGYLFISLSESLSDINTIFTTVHSGVFQKR